MVSAEGYYGTLLDGFPLARLKVQPSGIEARAEMLSEWIAGLVFADGPPVETSIDEMATTVERIVYDGLGATDPAHCARCNP
jgi:hypothetical protein